MTQIELRTVARGDEPRLYQQANALIDVARGDASAQWKLYGFDGNRHKTTGDSSGAAGSVTASGQYALDLHSSHASGLLLAARKIATTKDAALTPANSVLLLAAAGLYMGASTTIRIYAADGTDYVQMSSDADGGLVLGGSGANAGLISGDWTVTGNLKFKSGTAFVMTFDHALASADRTVTFPDAAGTVALLERAQTFSATNTFSSAAPIILSGTAARFTGPFGDATRGNRPFFQSSAANGDTNVSAMPSGSNTISKFEAYNNATPGSATVIASLEANNTEARLTSATQAGAAAALDIYTGATKVIGVTSGGVLTVPVTTYIGDTSNANVSLGLTINQGAADDVILSLKSSDVDNQMTDLVETDTYGDALKESATAGGLRIRGWSESTVGVKLIGLITTGDTTRATTAVGPVMTQASIKSANTAVALSTANQNIFVVCTGAAAQMLVDVEGDVHYNGTTNAGSWDDEPDDIALLEAFRVTTAPGVEESFRQRFSDDIAAHAEILAKTGVITLNPDGHHFVSTKGLNGLIIDSIRMLAAESRRDRVRLEQQVAGLQQQVQALAGGS